MWRSCTILMVSMHMITVGTGAHLSLSCAFPCLLINNFGRLHILLMSSIPVSVLIPGLAYSIAPLTVKVNDGILHLYSFSWLFGIIMYVAFIFTLEAVA